MASPHYILVQSRPGYHHQQICVFHFTYGFDHFVEKEAVVEGTIVKRLMRTGYHSFEDLVQLISYMIQDRGGIVQPNNNALIKIKPFL